jgi:hypothetical protein
MAEPIGIGFHAFTNEKPEEFGAVRGVSKDGRRLTVYIENAGEFELPAEAVERVAHQKVTFNVAKLDPEVREAIEHAHDAEIPNDDDIES